MENLGREDKQLLRRAVTALEKLAEDPILEIEGGPPICPNCHTMNPVVVTEVQSGQGPLSEFAIALECTSCGSSFFAVPLEWALFTTYQEAEEEIEKRREVFGAINT